MIEEESLVHGNSNSFLINMGSKDNIIFQGLHSKME
jgi:hypothetical protein